MKFLVQQQPVYVYTGGKPFDAAKPSIVFIHGSANDHSVWTMQARYFAHHGWNALAVDLPGHGKSFGAAKTSIASIADWLVNLLDNGNIGSAVLVGHSMGALVALEAAGRYPARVSRLALIGAGAAMPVSDALLTAANDDPNAAFDMLNIWGHAPQLRWGKNPTPGTSSICAYKRLLMQSAPGVLANDLRACNAFQMSEATQATIHIPTLIIAGTHDLLTPLKGARALVASLGKATLLTLDGAGHAMMQEAPGPVVDALKKFVVER